MNKKIVENKDSKQTAVEALVVATPSIEKKLNPAILSMARRT